MASQSLLFPVPVSVLLRPPKIYQFRIVFIGISPEIWRRIQVSSDCGFFALHSAIQDAFGWVENRPYSFEMFSRKPTAKSIELPFHNNLPSYEHDLYIRSYFACAGDAAMYVYDDQWLCNVMLEQIVDPSVGVSYPLCMDGRRCCAREEVVSLKYYRSRLKMASNPSHLKHLENVNVLASLGHSQHFNHQSVEFKDPKERFQPIRERFLQLNSVLFQ